MGRSGGVHWLPRALVALLVLSVLQAGAIGYALRDDQDLVLPEGTPAQRAAAAQVVQDLPLPDGARRDPYSTACRVSAPLCVTLSEAGSDREAVARLTRALRDRGARLVERHCVQWGGEAETDLYHCFARLTLGGVGVTVLGRERSGGNASTVTVFLPTLDLAGLERAEREHPSAPISSLASLGLGTAAWGKVTCKEPVSGGCRGLTAVGTVRGSPSAEAERWRSKVERAGFRVDSLTCSGSDRPRCDLSAARFRTVGGYDGVLVYVRVSRLPGGRLALRLRASSYGGGRAGT